MDKCLGRPVWRWNWQLCAYIRGVSCRVVPLIQLAVSMVFLPFIVLSIRYLSIYPFLSLPPLFTSYRPLDIFLCHSSLSRRTPRLRYNIIFFLHLIATSLLYLLPFSADPRYLFPRSDYRQRLHRALSLHNFQRWCCFLNRVGVGHQIHRLYKLLNIIT